jgi:site-specific recombinase XerD
MGTIYRSVYDNRIPVSRDSLKITIPVRLWDKKKQEVRNSPEIDFEKMNFVINQFKLDFLAANKKSEWSNKDCFIEFSMDFLEKNYKNEETKKKYTTVIRSLQKYVNENLGLQQLPIDEIRKIDFIKGYKNWVFTRQYKKRDSAINKRTKTVFNYVVVIQTFVKKYNELHPEREEIKTIHYCSGLNDFDPVESKMLYPDEIDRLINYQPQTNRKKDKTLEAKHHFLFQFFASGLRVSDILLLNYKHFTKGRIELVVKKNGKKISVPFVYKACKILGFFYPQEYHAAVLEHPLGDVDVSADEVEHLIKINSLRKPLADLTIEDLYQFRQFLLNDRTNDNAHRLEVLKGVLNRMEQNIADSMCRIMGEKPSGLVFDYLNYEDFKDLKVMDRKQLSKVQSQLLQRARASYNSRLARIASRIGVNKITSHVSRHSFAYYMLYTGATVEEISFALGHSKIEVTQAYIKQFPSRYSDEAIKRFGESFNV